MIFRQVLLTGQVRSVWKTVRRICIFISSLITQLTAGSSLSKHETSSEALATSDTGGS